MGLMSDLVEGRSRVVAEGEPASPHPEDCTCGLACTTSAHQNNRAGGVWVALDDGLLRGRHAEREVYLHFTHILHLPRAAAQNTLRLGWIDMSRDMQVQLELL